MVCNILRIVHLKNPPYGVYQVRGTKRTSSAQAGQQANSLNLFINYERFYYSIKMKML